MRAVLADDDPGARRALRAALAEAADVDVVGEFATGRAALDGIRRLRPDIAFLDIEMPEPDGLDIAAELAGTSAPAIVFVTAWRQHALDAFGLDVVDYVLKPFEDARIAEAVERAVRRSAGGPRPRVRDTGAAGYARRFLVRHEHRLHFVPVEDVDWLEADRNYVLLHVGARAFRVRGNLATFMDSLDPRLFARIHRSTAVNLERVAELQPWFNGDWIAILRDGRQLRVSRTFRRALLEPLS